MYVLIDTTDQTAKVLGVVVDSYRIFPKAAAELISRNKHLKAQESLYTLWRSDKRPKIGSKVRFRDEKNYEPLTSEDYARLMVYKYL
jgi:hypothetical protein